jgi:hypothetical protein
MPLQGRDLFLNTPIGWKLWVMRRPARVFEKPYRPLPTYATRPMQCRVTALVHERRRLMEAGHRPGTPRVERLTLRLLQALLAEEGLVIRTKITGGRQPIRVERGWRAT